MNVVSRRVRQLTLGYRPLVVVPPGMLAADVALTEIIGGKLTSQPAIGEDSGKRMLFVSGHGDERQEGGVIEPMKKDAVKQFFLRRSR